MARSADDRWIRQCQICGEDFRQLRPKQIACSVACRAKLPHNTGGPRTKAGLGLRVCTGCGAEFQPVRGKQLACSAECYRKSPARRAAQDRANDRRRNDPDVSARIREYNRAKELRIRYGMTVAEYEAQLAAQEGVCMICGQPPNPSGVRAASRLHIDHDHATGRNRALICLNCNRGLGYFKDDPDLMRAAAAYIERHLQEDLPDAELDRAVRVP